MSTVLRSTTTTSSTSTTSVRATRSRTMVRRRIGGRFPIDAFGFDPQIVDLVTPVFDTLLRVEVEGGEHVPATGPAAIVANRGFGIFEPSVLGIAVRRTVARRLRIVGAPEVPALGGLVRRLGAISSSAPDMRACLRAGQSRRGAARTHVVADRRGHPAPSAAAGDDQRADRARRGHARADRSAPRSVRGGCASARS